MFTIHIDEGGIDQLLTDLTGFETDLDRRQQPLQEVKERQIERWNRNYMSQGGEYQSWAPNAAATVRDRARRGYATFPPLIVTGRTLSHFQTQNEEGDVSASAIEWNFTNQPGGDRWASTVSHHTGYTLGKSRVPARMLWDLDRQDEDALKQAFEEYLTEITAKHNLD